MNPILKFIQMLIILLVGTKNIQPVNDLHRKPTREDHLKKLDFTIQKYRHILFALFFLGIFIVFVWVCFTVVGASAVESGIVYNHLGDFV